jgi:hypothetical protein
MTISNTAEPISLASLVDTCLHAIRFDITNNVSTPQYLNPWRLNLQESFPYISLKTLSNLSRIFSPSFNRAMFVRHPFERLGSAYKERIATLEKDRLQPEPEYDAIRRSICHQYDTRFNITHHPLPEIDRCVEVIPSFEQFIRYILTNARTPAGTNGLDLHWQPYSIVCQVCKFKYNFIGKYETFYDDITYLLKSLNLPDWNIQKRRGASGYSIWDYRRLFLSLPDELICQLRHLYADDFRLFNYRVEDYVNRSTLICQSQAETEKQ